MEFTYVHIPADVSQPIAEKRLKIPPGKDVECLLDTIKAELKAVNPQSSSEQAAAHRQAMLRSVPAGTQVPEELLSIAGSMQMVESLPLLANSKANGFVGVNMYVDDTGSIKNLPINVRASDICRCCGRELQVHGDAWLARLFDNEDDFKRLDFSLTEVSSTADWVKLAQAQFQAKMRAEAPEVTIKRMSQVASKQQKQVAITELSPAEAAKEEGNAAFKKGDLECAVRLYSQCLSLDASMVVARNNRAMTLLRVERYAEALEDCDAVLAAEPGNVKAWLRKGEAHMMLGSQADAKAAWERCLQLQPSNAQALENLAKLDLGRELCQSCLR